jgi:multidrug efflux pump subunit AcrB
MGDPQPGAHRLPDAGRGDRRRPSPSSTSAATRTRASPSRPCWSPPSGPGATMEETQRQLTDRLERRLEETTGLDALRSITRPGIVTIYVDLDGAFPPERVPSVWQEVRNGIGDIRHTLPQGVLGPVLQRRLRRRLRHHLRLHRRRLLRPRAARLRRRRALAPAARGRRDRKIEFIGAQDETVLIEFQPDRVAAMGLDYGQIFNAIAAQNVVRPSGTINSGQENLVLRVTGAFETEERHSRGLADRRGARDPARRHRHGAARLRRSAAAAAARQRPARHRARDLDARGRRHP